MTIESKSCSVVCLILDSPMNALVAACMIQECKCLHCIYAIDTTRKNLDEYLFIYRSLLSSFNIIEETIIEYDSVEYWKTGKNSTSVKKALELFNNNGNNYIYYGNVLTNPVASALRSLVKINHLYHGPCDFLQLPVHDRLFFKLKLFIKHKILLSRNRKDLSVFPVATPFEIANDRRFKYVDLSHFKSNKLEIGLSKLLERTSNQKNKILLLLAGDEPVAGDGNQSNILNYIHPHLNSVQIIIEKFKLKDVNVWFKEHKSYLPLTTSEKKVLNTSFNGIGCKTFYISDYIDDRYRILPGECILSLASFDYILGEPSSLIINAPNTIKRFLMVKIFENYRDDGQKLRNSQLVSINSLISNPAEVI